MVLKTKMVKRLPVLEAMRKGQALYRLEHTDFFRSNFWVEPGDPDTPLVESILRVDIPTIIDYQGQLSSFTAFEKFPDDGTSGWWAGDSRFDEANCPYRIYASQGTNAAGDAAIIMCCDDNLNVKRICVKYVSTPTGPIEDL